MFHSTKSINLVIRIIDNLSSFGLGTHSCPGRFFGANTVKLVLTHLLMKYEFKPSDGTVVEPLKFGFSMLANPSTKMMIRRSRKEVGW